MQALIDWRAIIQAAILACILGLGNKVVSHDKEIAGVSAKLDAVHEDVREIKRLFLQRGVNN